MVALSDRGEAEVGDLPASRTIAAHHEGTPAELAVDGGVAYPEVMSHAVKLSGQVAVVAVTVDRPERARTGHAGSTRQNREVPCGF